MLDLITRVRSRLTSGSYVNEAAVSHGVVTPILNALGWDSSDPDQLVPEFTLGRGRVDFALLGTGRRPSVFIEVKNVGHAADGDRQLFEYAFHEGVPLCVLTDGREWSFYLPSGQGSYEDRRIYRLQLDDRDPAECESVLIRYLSRERVRNGAAFNDAQRDYRDAAGRREAATALPRAWRDLVAAPAELLIELLADQAELLCGFRPIATDVLEFLNKLGAEEPLVPRPPRAVATVQPLLPRPAPAPAPARKPRLLHEHAISSAGREITYRIFGGNQALVEILATLSDRDPSRLSDLAKAVKGSTRNHIARSAEDIYPERLDLARPAREFHPGWYVGLNIANREKMRIIRSACMIYGLTMPGDVDISLPNAN